jgi:2-polyprenyl-6-methoxyphenol hydroxylase-like FAD-dependent oxidoreductase
MDTDVIVVGAGPVGLMLAGELRLGGARVIVLERLTEATTESRASTLHARTMEIFDQRGLLDQLGTPPSQNGGHFGGIPLDFGNLPTGYPGQWKVLQTRVEELLAAWATELGADIRRGHDVCGLELGDDRIRVHAGSPTGTVELTGRYLVGCDGEHSTVRGLAGVDFPGVEATNELLRADVVGIEVPDRRFERLPNGLAISSRRPDGVTRVMVSTFDRPVGQRVEPPSWEEITKVWELVTGEDIRHGTPIWRNAFDNTSRLVSRYLDDRVLLAGDAAHCQMPSGGQAINLGIQDAANLGWKLAAVATGRAPARLLDTYHDERHEVGRRVLSNIEAQGLLLLGGPEVDSTRAVLAELIRYPVVRDRLAAMISGIDVRYGDDPHPLVGARMPHIELDTEDGPTSTTELLRTGHGVLLDTAACAGRHDWLRGATAGWVDLVAAAPPSEGTLAGLETVLLRPDGYVAWVGDRYSDPRWQISRWFGRDPQ